MPVLCQKIEEQQTKACPRLTVVLLYIHVAQDRSQNACFYWDLLYGLKN